MMRHFDMLPNEFDLIKIKQELNRLNDVNQQFIIDKKVHDRKEKNIAKYTICRQNNRKISFLDNRNNELIKKTKRQSFQGWTIFSRLDNHFDFNFQRQVKKSEQ